MPLTLIDNIGELVTLAPAVASGRLVGLAEADLGRCQGPAWLSVADGKVLASGQGPYAGPPPDHKLDAAGGLVLPGLVDAHTHLLFAGSRAKEFTARASGLSYQEIAAQGGGIRSTMLATRQAKDSELRQLLQQRLHRALRFGITTVEIKSGYGLSVAEELRQLQLLQRLRLEHSQQTLVTTCLALHAASPEYPDLDSYVAAVCSELLPEVAAQGLAHACDAFVEQGYFSTKQVTPYAAKAKDLGLGLRLHADEFSDAGAAGFAAAWQALSADHLQFASAASLRAMAAAGTIAVLLPGTSLYCKLPFTSGRRLADAGVAVAVATDFNPGSCQLDNLAMMVALATVHGGLTPAEALAGATWVAASSLGLGASKGTLARGYDADLAIYPLTDFDSWLADFGRTPPRQVLHRGISVITPSAEASSNSQH